MKLFSTKYIYAFLTAGICVGSIPVMAQDKNKELDIISSFKPVLREASKINFNAQPPLKDSSRPVLKYDIPAQQLAFNYQTASLNPLAYENNFSSAWQNTNFLQVGAGNVHLPYVKAGFSFGDGQKTNLNIFGEHSSGKGRLDFQEHHRTSIGAVGTYRNEHNMEWMGAIGYKRNQFYYYGYEPRSLTFNKSDLKQLFQTVEGQLSVRNLQQTATGFNYHPSIKVSNFKDFPDPAAFETNVVINAPVERYFGNSFGMSASLLGDFTTYTNKLPGYDFKQNLSLYQVGLNVLYKSENVYIKGGVIPSWDNKEYKMLPNITADITTSSQKFTLQLGFIGYYNKGSYQRFAGLNQWLSRPDTLFNQSIIERYVGVKGSVGDHVTFALKGGVHTYRNTPLFVNAGPDGKQFDIRYEPKMNVVQLKSELGYTVGEKFNVKGGFEFNNFSGLTVEQRAWGMLPLQFNLGMGWQPFENFMLNADLKAWDGPRYLTLTGDDFKGDGATDLSFGASYKVVKNIEVWLQANNVFNQYYARWNQYENYGFNLLGGVIIYFNQKKTN